MHLARRQETWDPFRELEEVSNRMNRFLGLGGWPGNALTRLYGNGERELLARTDWSPSCDISETDKEYRIRAELPSVAKDDVHVTLEDGLLTIRGERREEKEDKGVRFHRRELWQGNFLRRFTMPDDADESHVDASFKDGVLNVVISRTKARASKAREIAVH